MGTGVIRASSAPKPEWHLLQPVHAPAGRTSPALSYDSQRKVAVLFGGSYSWTSSGAWVALNDTWEWDGSDWLQRHPAVSPPARLDSAMAYDPERGTTVLFGGQDQNLMYSDTCEWNGQHWRQVSPMTSPPARCSFGMFYDPQRQAVVIYGGFAREEDSSPGETKNVFFDDAWEWDGQNWSQISQGSPRADDVFAIVYDQARGLPILMDGSGLWYWQVDGWQPHNSGNDPPGRFSSRGFILYGGLDSQNDLLSDTWAYAEP